MAQSRHEIVHRTCPLSGVKRTCSTHCTGPLPDQAALAQHRSDPMTGPLRLVILVAALAALLAIVMATDGHPLAVIAAIFVAIFLTGRLTR